jgi:hypothetical protein
LHHASSLVSSTMRLQDEVTHIYHAWKTDQNRRTGTSRQASTRIVRNPVSVGPTNTRDEWLKQINECVYADSKHY